MKKRNIQHRDHSPGPITIVETTGDDEERERLLGALAVHGLHADSYCARNSSAKIGDQSLDYLRGRLESVRLLAGEGSS